MGPSVVMASPGFLQSGVSRQLFEAWCDDAKNGVIIAGYTVEGTMAADLLSFPTEIKCLDNRIKPRRCQIECIAFAAHVDYNQNKAFIKSTTPDYIILVHGEKTNMRRLKEGLESEMRSGSWPTTHKPSIATPENGTRVRLRFRKHTIANVVGSAVARITNSLDMVKEKNKKESNRSTAIAELPAKSILVTENFTSKLVTAGELSSFTSCKFGRITQRMTIPLPKGLSPAAFRPLAYPTSPPLSEMTFSGESLLEHIESNLEDVFDSLLYCEDANEEVVDVNSHLVGNKCLLVEGLVKIREGFVQENESFRLSHIEVRWSASPIADTIADCCVGMMLQMFSAISLLRHSMQAGHKAIRSKQTKDSMQSKEDKLSGKNVDESIKTDPSPLEHPEANVRSKKRKTTK